MDTGKSVIGQVEGNIVRNYSNDAFQIEFFKCRSNCTMSSDSETEFVDHKYTTDSYQEQNEEKLDGKNVNQTDHSTFFESSTCTINTVGIKNDAIDIIYEDLKRETAEEISRESIGFCEVCYQSFGNETDFIKSTTHRSECCCQKQNVPSLPSFYNISGEDLTFDVEPPLLDFSIESRFRPLEVPDKTISEDEVAKEQDSSAIPRSVSVLPKENFNKKKLIICLERFETNISLAVRKNQYRGCSKSFSQYNSLKIDKGHTGKKPFQCKICAKSFKMLGDLRVHGRIHTGEKPFHCKICSKAFSILGNMRVHEKIHTSKKTFQCKICAKSFKRLNHLLVHGTIHTGKKPFNCEICLKAYSHPNTLKVHQRIHTAEKSFHCKICSKSFSRMDYLKCHERMHTDDSPFRCKICSKGFCTPNYLKIHGRIHTGEKPFHCKVCLKAFSHKQVLRYHLRIHTGEKPFNCKICSKSFGRMDHLKCHERIHTGEKPFDCKICSKSFKQIVHLKNHERVHTGEKPFCCKICSKSFRQRFDMQRHERGLTCKKISK